jgi:protein-tyrosine phosphatase
MIEEHNLSDRLMCDSCGTSSNHIGEQPDARTIKIAKKYQVSIYHQAQQLKINDFDTYDHIIAMDESNLKDIRKVLGSKTHPRIELMRAYEPYSSETSVPDPWFGDMRDFEYCYQLLYTCCKHLIQEYI